MKLSIVFIVSWIAGLAAYLATLALVYGQAIGSGDLTAVLFWSLVAYALAFVLVYLPALFALRRWLGGVSPAWPFVVVATLIGAGPVALIALLNGGDWRSLLSAEAKLFFIMFTAIGIVLGQGFVHLHRREAPRAPV